MKINIYKNKIRKTNIITFEIKQRILLFLLKSQNIQINDKYCLLNKFSKILKKATHTKYNSVCFVTGRSRGNVSVYGVSRIIFKELASNGKISGIKRHNC
uniref:Ribosomal protein S14 n=1 Tax=Cyanophora biloba TaxID=1489483 RepID=A0A873WY82_9EUKA|nr:hypothetical protein DXZ13_mgp19 [Cyanophora biloba]QPB15032.1 hypothetical protein [Cyanophora biloba]